MKALLSLGSKLLTQDWADLPLDLAVLVFFPPFLFFFNIFVFAKWVTLLIILLKSAITIDNILNRHSKEENNDLMGHFGSICFQSKVILKTNNITFFCPIPPPPNKKMPCTPH